MGINDFIKIGSRIKNLRIRKGISQKDMAEMLDIPRSTYSNYENDNREPSIETLEKIASILGINTSDLIGTQITDMQKLLQDTINHNEITLEDISLKTNIDLNRLTNFNNGCDYDVSDFELIAKTFWGSSFRYFIFKILMNFSKEIAETTYKNTLDVLIDDYPLFDRLSQYENNISKYWRDVVLWYPLTEYNGTNLDKLEDEELDEISKALEFTFDLKLCELRNKKNNK